jgi:hypothetical protein
MPTRTRVAARAAFLGLGLLLTASIALAQPAPQPFPRPGSQPPPAPPTDAAPAPAPRQPQATPPQPEGPTEAELGVPIYPAAQFLGSYDAGRGQRYYLFGVSLGFAEAVTYYRNILRQRGNVVFETPATHVFEIGRFRENEMAFPPSVTVKDYTWGGSAGYPNPVLRGQPERFPTIIQIVPPPPGTPPER